MKTSHPPTGPSGQVPGTKTGPTPGPWEVSDAPTKCQVRAHTSQRPIANCETPGNTWPQDRRNAILIAAAPELLEALKAMVACCTNGDGAISPEPHDRGAWLDGMVTAREAITKAEG